MESELKTDAQTTLSTLAAGSQIILELRSGEAVDGQLRSFDGSSVTLATETGEKLVPLDQVIAIFRRNRRPTSS